MVIDFILLDMMLQIAPNELTQHKVERVYWWRDKLRCCKDILFCMVDHTRQIQGLLEVLCVGVKSIHCQCQSTKHTLKLAAVVHHNFGLLRWYKDILFWYIIWLVLYIFNGIERISPHKSKHQALTNRDETVKSVKIWKVRSYGVARTFYFGLLRWYKEFYFGILYGLFCTFPMALKEYHLTSPCIRPWPTGMKSITGTLRKIMWPPR